jgi:hypothetical protein
MSHQKDNSLRSIGAGESRSAELQHHIHGAGDITVINQMLPLPPAKTAEDMAVLREEDFIAQCPICHDAIDTQCVMFPCGHQVNDKLLCVGQV